MHDPMDPTTPTDQRPTLTRVDVDPSQVVDEPAAAWCRHEIRRIVAWRLVATGALVFGAATPVWWWQRGPAWAIAGSSFLAAAVVGARWWVARRTAPLGHGYVRRYLELPPEFVLVHGRMPAPDDPSAAAQALSEPGELDRGPNQDADGDQGQGQADDDGVRPNAEALRELGFAPVAAVRSEGPDARVVDLYRDGDRIVVAVDRTSGSTTVLTELVGFRVLVTTALLVPPTDELVVNVVADGDTPGLVLSHQRLVRQAFRSRTLPSEPVGLFKLAQQRELQAYRDLGARWGALIDLRCRPRGVRLLAAPSAGEVLLFTGNKLFRQTTGPSGARSARTAPAGTAVLEPPAGNGPTT